MRKELIDQKNFMLMVKERLSLNSFARDVSPNDPSRDLSMCDTARERCLQNEERF